MNEFSTPSSQSVEQFTVPVNKLSIEQPAINGMADAFQRGIMNFTDLIKAGSVPGAERAKQEEDRLRKERASAERGMLPEAVAADKEALALKIKKIQSDLSDLAIKAQVQPTHDATVRSQAEATKIAAEEQAKVAKQIEITRALEEQTGYSGMTDRTKRYLAANGELPYSAENPEAIDYKKVDAWAAANMPSASTKSSDTLTTESVKAGAPLYDPKTGRKLTDQELDAGLVKKFEEQVQAKRELTPIQQAESEFAQRNAREMLSNVTSAKKIVGGPDNVVGTVIGQPWNPYLWAKSVFGDDTPVNQQAELKRLSGMLTAEQTLKLKGAISNKEMQIMQGTVPQVWNNEPVWDKFLAEKLEILKEVVESGMTKAARFEQAGYLPNGLPDSSQIRPSPGRPNPETARPSPIKAGAGSSKETPIMAVTKEAWAAMASGTWYWNAKHQLAVQKP